MRFMLALFLLVLSAAPARSEDARPKIAILPFDVGLTHQFDALKEGLPDILAACFSAHSGMIEILDRSHIESIAEEATQNFKIRDIHLKAATHLLRGSVAPHEKGFVMTLMVYELATARLVAEAAVADATGYLAKASCNGADAIAARLKPETAYGAGGDREKEEQGRLMIEGLGYYYNGAHEKAFPSFMKLLKLAPENASARYWLGKSYHAAGMQDAARIEFRKFLDRFPDDPRSAEVSAYLQPAKEKQP